MTNQEKWIEFCKTHDADVQLYGKPFWLDAVCNGRENWNVFLVEDRGEIQAAMPYYIKRRMGIPYITMPQLTQRNGIFLKKSASEKTEKIINYENKMYNQLIAQCEQAGFSFYNQCFSIETTNWQPFYWKGYQQKTMYTFCIDTPNDLEQAEKNFSQSVRSNLKKARKIGTVSEFDDIELFYRINSMSFERQGMQNPVPFALIKRLYEGCKANNALKMLYAKDPDGNICDVALYAYDATCVYAMLCGTDPSKRKYNLHTLLTYEGIKFACETGRRLDFEGSMMEGVSNSLLSFGAEMYPYYSIKKVYLKTPILSQLMKYKLYA